MVTEVFPKDASDDYEVYHSEILRNMADPNIVILIDSHHKGFVMVRDDTEALTPTLKRYNIIRAYIEPNSRGSRIYIKMMREIEKRFKDGDIIGMTEINSNHIPILVKRQELIAMVFKFRKGD